MAITTLQALGVKIAADDAISFGTPYEIARLSSYSEHVKHAVNAGMPVVICDANPADMPDPDDDDYTGVTVYSCIRDLVDFIDDHIRSANETGTFVMCPNDDGSVKFVIFYVGEQLTYYCLLYGLDQDTLSRYMKRERLIASGPLIGIPYGKTMASCQIENAIGYDAWFPILTCADPTRHPIAIVDDGDDSSMQYVFFEDLTALVAYCRSNDKTLVPDAAAVYPPNMPYVSGCHGEYNPDPEWEDNYMFYVVGASRDEIIAAFDG